MAVLTRTQIEQARQLPREVVPVPELGGDVIVQGMSGTEREAWEASIFDAEGNRRDPQDRHFRARLVIRSVVDDAGQRLFADDDVELVSAFRYDILNRLFTVAQRLSRVGGGSGEAL